MMILSSQHMLPRMCPLTTESNDYLRCDWETHFKWLAVTNLKIKSKDTLHWTFAQSLLSLVGFWGHRHEFCSGQQFCRIILVFLSHSIVTVYCPASCSVPPRELKKKKKLCRPTIMQNHDAFDDDSVANYSNNSGQTLSIPIGALLLTTLSLLPLRGTASSHRQGDAIHIQDAIVYKKWPIK